jgi:ABC-type sugar transport system ATPase subunit
MAALEIRNLTKTFKNGTVAVRDLSFEVADQEAVFVLGPSGAGKTTTLRLVAGLEDADAGGEVWIGGRNVVHDTPRERNVAMVYDKHSLFPHLSVFENLAYPLRIRRLKPAAMRERIAEVATVLQISELLDRMPSQLSGGQMQRVAIGRALVRDADAFLLDEPISHLDAQLRARMRVEFKRLQREFKATMLYVSHDQLEAMTMADRIVLLDQGRIEQIGEPQHLFDRPVSEFAATFIGEPKINVLPVSLVEEGGRSFIEIGTSLIPVKNEWLARAGLTRSAKRAYRLGMRPQHLRLAAAADRGEHVVHGRIYAVETLGSRAIFDIEIGDSVVRVMTSVDEARRHPFDNGAPVGFEIDPDFIYLFDTQTRRTAAYAEFSSNPHRLN